ncbi:MAG: porin family protein [Alphaproteobacteria bacterium]|nr:porin family protein [Alphaproteobacteria bacterium]
MRQWVVSVAALIAATVTDSSFAQQSAPASAAPAAAPAPRSRYDYLAVRLTGGPAAISDVKNVGTRAGVPTNTEDNDLVGAGGAAIGFDWQKFGWPVRTELEYNLAFRFDYNARPPLSTNGGFGLENNLKSHAFMLNAYYDIRNKTRWTPYLAVGVGLARNTSEGTFSELAQIPGRRIQTREDTKNNLAYFGGLGVRYGLSESWIVEAGYRFMYLGKAKTGPFFDGTSIELNKYTKHDFLIGMAYAF